MVDYTSGNHIGGICKRSGGLQYYGKTTAKYGADAQKESKYNKSIAKPATCYLAVHIWHEIQK